MDELSESDIQYYPLDFDALQKGDVITIDRLEAITDKQRGTQAFQLAVLSLRERIINECKDRDRFFTVAIVKGNLRILTDEEAAVYNSRTFKMGMKRSRKSLSRLAKVDMNNLDDLQKKSHERNLIVFGKMLQAARSAQKSLTAAPHQRTLPGLPEPNGANVETKE
jgi:hypothetical protein